MSLTLAQVYLPHVVDALTAQSGFIDRLNMMPAPGVIEAGPCTFRYLSSSGAVDAPTEGTLLTGNISNTVAAGTMKNKFSTFAVLPDEFNNPDTVEAASTSVAQKSADDILTAAKTDIVSLLYTNIGSVTITQTLVSGNENFSTDGSDADIRANLQALTKVISTVASNNNGKINDLTIVTTPEVWGNISSYGTQVAGQISYDATGMPLFQGIPVFTEPAGTNLGATTKPCVWVLSKSAVGFAMAKPELFGGGIQAWGDGRYKMVTVGWYGYAALAIAKGVGKVVNGSFS